MLKICSDLISTAHHYSQNNLSTHLLNKMLRKSIWHNSLRKLSIQAEKVKNDGRRWRSVVGLEVHAQISTESKLFSGSGTKFGSAVNTSVAYFDASIPGTLPVLNRKCVELGVKTALALGCRVNEVSMFDRKHYFYADLPAGYQITQQRAALANDGQVTFPVMVPSKKTYQKTVQLLQLQLEQDSGKSIHDEDLRRSLVDLNRAGVPLMELVFAPDLETGDEAASLVKELIIILRRLKSCSCKMEEGALRVDANISVHLEGDPLGVRTEVKNIGSLRGISQAVYFEIKRQLEVVSNGGTIINETRSWNAESKCTVVMRDKEVLQDYRFMPEPNLTPLHLHTSGVNNNMLVSVPKIFNTLPELPRETRNRLMNEFKINQETAFILVNEPKLLDYFTNSMQILPVQSAKLVANFLVNDILTYCNKSNISIDECQLSASHLVDILRSLQNDVINLQAGRDLIAILHSNPTAEFLSLVREHNLEQISDPIIIEQFCKRAIENLPDAVKKYRSGKSKILLAIVGEVAKVTDRRTNMKIVKTCLEKLLKEK